jgi:hypothetical protein
VVIAGDTGTDLRPLVFRAAVESGAFTIYEMTRERTSMEDIFRELTADGNAVADAADGETANGPPKEATDDV